MDISLSEFVVVLRQTGVMPPGRTNRGLRRIGIRARQLGGVVIRRNVPAIGLGNTAPRSSVIYRFPNRVAGMEFVRTARP
jgi:hypothetical protein